MNNMENLERRFMCYADSLFKHKTVRLLPGHLYEISHPITLRSNQKIIGLSAENPPIVRYVKNNSGGIFIMPEKSWNIRIRNVHFEGKGKTSAIRVSGGKHYIGNVSVSSKTGSAVIMANAYNVLIENCNQETYTQRGFIYGHDIKNVTIRNITTSGNLYENDLRFHAFNGLFMSNIKIDGANPKTQIYRNKYAGVKDNALRIHDGYNAVVNGLTATGNVTFGVMDQDSGGYSDLMRGKMSVYYKKMKMHSYINAKNINIYGNLVLATNLHFKISNMNIVSWKRGECISFNPKYGPFKRDSHKMFRDTAKGVFSNVRARFVHSPGDRNVNSLMKYFSKKRPFSDNHITDWIPKDVSFKNTVFNSHLLYK